MEKTVLKVDGMSCEHCVKAITKAVGALSGVDQVTVDLDAKTVAVSYDPKKSTLDAIKVEIDDQGYDVVA
ncbi:copper chaperone CopZ [Lachnospiraceae bacterium ZAX-1]